MKRYELIITILVVATAIFVIIGILTPPNDEIVLEEEVRWTYIKSYGSDIVLEIKWVKGVENLELVIHNYNNVSVVLTEAPLTYDFDAKWVHFVTGVEKLIQDPIKVYDVDDYIYRYNGDLIEYLGD